MPATRRVLCGDVGGSSVKIGVVERDGDQVRLTGRTEVKLVDPLCLEPSLAAVAEAWRGLASGDSADAVVLALPKMVDPRTGRVSGRNQKVDDAETLDFAGWAEAEFGRPIVLENDARAALIGEWRAGAGQGTGDLLMVTLGTGVGTAAVIDGRVLRAGHGHGGVLGGHLTLRLEGQVCDCGNVGCVEAEASTSRLKDLIDRINVETYGHQDTPLHRLNPPSYRDVFELAGQGDALAVAVRDESYRVWSAGALNLVLAYGSRRVLVGGGVAAGADGLCAFMEDYINTHGWITWGRVEVKPAALGNDAALWGGLFLAEEFLGTGSK